MAWRCVLLIPAIAFAAGLAAQGVPAQPGSGEVVRAARQIQTGDAARSGDADLSCEEIGAQLQGMFGSGNMQHMLSSAQDADEKVRATQKEAAVRQAAEAPGLVGQSLAEAAMATNPVTAMAGGMAANAAAAARGRAMQADAVRDGQAGNMALQRFKDSSANLVTSDTDQLTRMRRLSELSEEKGCRPPPGMPLGEGDDEDEAGPYFGEDEDE